MKVSVIGGGSWGLTLAKVLSDNSHNVLVYDVHPLFMHRVNDLHICAQLDEYIPTNIKGTNNLEEAINYSDIILMAVPTKVLRAVLKDINSIISTASLFINVSKGLEPETFKRVSEVVYEEINNDYIKGFVSLTGPSHAEEVIKNMVTTVTSASEDENCAKTVQDLFNNNTYFRVYTSNDLLGAELGGALKNVYALASGICRGLNMGDNTIAALITRGLKEMKKVYISFGADPNSLMGLTGVGDLIVTCTSENSRNYQAGFKIGHGKDLEFILDNMTMEVEGIRTCKAVYEYGKKNNLDLPILYSAYDVVINKKSPKISLQALMDRVITSE